MGFVESYAAVTGDGVPLGARYWPTRRVPVAGVDLVVRDVPGAAADLPPALFVHGLGGSGERPYAEGRGFAGIAQRGSPSRPQY